MRNKQLDNRPTSDVEQKLINIGHHIWRQRKEWPALAISRALQAVWDTKEAVRAPLRSAWLETLRNRIIALHARRRP